MTRFSLMILSLIAMVGLTACETVEGAGRDIQNAGEAVTATAQNAGS